MPYFNESLSDYQVAPELDLQGTMKLENVLLVDDTTDDVAARKVPTEFNGNRDVAKIRHGEVKWVKIYL